MKLTLSLVIPNSMKVNPTQIYQHPKKRERERESERGQYLRPKPREDSGKVCGL